MSMKPYEGAISSLTDTPFGYTLSMIDARIKIVQVKMRIQHDYLMV